MGLQRQVDIERVSRYRKVYPYDQRTDREILKALNIARKDKALINMLVEKWISDKR